MKRRTVREPVQVYLTRDEKRLLDSLSEELGLSRAEILRRGLRSFGMEHGGGSMLAFLESAARGEWPDQQVAERHDEVLAASHRPNPDPE